MSVVRKGSSTLPPNLKIVITAIRFAAIALMAFGAGCFIFPEYVMNFIGLDQFSLNIMGATLLFAGIVEYFIIPKLLINSNLQARKND